MKCTNTVQNIQRKMQHLTIKDVKVILIMMLRMIKAMQYSEVPHAFHASGQPNLWYKNSHSVQPLHWTHTKVNFLRNKFAKAGFL